MLLLPGIPERPVAVIPVRQVVAILAEHPAAATPGLRRPSREVIREVVAVTAAVLQAINKVIWFDCKIFWEVGIPTSAPYLK